MIIVLIILLIILLLSTLLLSSADRQIILSTQKTLMHNNLERKYITYTHNNEPKQIIVGLHGLGDSNKRFAYYTGLHNVDNSTLYVYPNSVEPIQENTRRGWNAGFCCGSGWLNKIDDAGFILELINNLKDEYNIKSDKIFVTGFSNGAFMAQKLAAQFPKIIKGVSISSGSIGTNKSSLKPVKPMPILLMHGKNDKIVPYDGGAGSTDPDFIWKSFADTTSTWKKVNKNDTKTEVKVYDENGHSWNDWRIFNFWHKKPQASIDTLEFFNTL